MGADTDVRPGLPMSKARGSEGKAAPEGSDSAITSQKKPAFTVACLSACTDS